MLIIMYLYFIQCWKILLNNCVKEKKTEIKIHLIKIETLKTTTNKNDKSLTKTKRKQKIQNKS